MNTHDDCCFIHVAGSPKPAIVDKQMALSVLSHRYNLSTDGYAIRNSKVALGEPRGERIYLHHEVLGIKGQDKKAAQYTFLNRNRLDCRIRNLALVDISTKGSRSKLSKANKSGFKGVSWSNQCNKWVANIYANGKKHHLGFYEDKTDAAIAYDQASRKLFGDKSVTNEDLGLFT